MSQIDLILLALLYEKDCYGYEIEAIIEERHMRDWTEIGFSSIYNSLNKLEKKGLIESRFEKEHGSPNRKVYTANEDTKVLVLNEIRRVLQSPARVYSEFDIGMAFSYLLPHDMVLASLNEYKKSLVNRKENILKRLEEQPQVKNIAHLKALFTRPLQLIDAEINWINEFGLA